MLLLLLQAKISFAFASTTSSYDFSDYMVNLREKIQKTWVVPQVMEEGHAIVNFKLDRAGNIVYSDIKQSSGNEVFDGSAINALYKAAPFGNFPSETNKEFITIRYSFDASIIDTDKMKTYVEKSERCLNVDNIAARSYIDLAIKELDGNPASYFLYARRHKIDKLIGDHKAAEYDLKKCKELKTEYDENRIRICKAALEKEKTSFGYFSLANAYDAAGDYKNALAAIDKAIEMTPLNQAYKRYRVEIFARNSE